MTGLKHFFSINTGRRQYGWHSSSMRSLLCLALILQLFVPLQHAFAASRIKDLVDVEGIRDNQLIGYGLIVGLNGSGDSLGSSPFTLQSIQAMLERLGVNTLGTNLRTSNTAAVIVTANLPPFSTQGSRIDVNISSLGDAKSLQGGTLLVTPLRGADGEVYAVAQGAVAIGGFSAEGDGASVTRGVPTSGRISNGAIIEQEINYNLAAQSQVRLALRNPDLTTAMRIAGTINSFLGVDAAKATDPATIHLRKLPELQGDIVSILADIEQLRVPTDQPAKIIIDESTGIIVMGKDVKISTVAVAQGSLTVTITEQPQVSQPSPLSNGTTEVVPNTSITVNPDSDQKIAILSEGVTVSELVNGLNSLGIGPRDLISILLAIKAAGALQADVEIL